MDSRRKLHHCKVIAAAALVLILLSACNLGRPRQDSRGLAITNIPESATEFVTAVATAATAAPTHAPTSIPLATLVPVFATREISAPTAIRFPTHTPLPISVFIASPLPNMVISGSTQLLGSAIHPGFLQYHIEYANVPNPQNIWYPASGAGHRPVINGVLGIWNTANGSIVDGAYQLRLRVFLFDGGEETAVLAPVYVKNQSFSVPTAAPVQVALPSSEYSVNVNSGFAPLTASFTGPSGAAITAYSWIFGDGNLSNEANPSHTFNEPGLYSVNLTVSGPAGSSSFARQITVSARKSLVAAFDASPSFGAAPLQVQFSDTSSGEKTSFVWKFGDGDENRTELNPSHSYTAEGSYIVELVMSGPSGQSSASKQIIVSAESVPPPVASFETSVSERTGPLSLQLTDTSSGEIDSYLWDFNDDALTDSTVRHPETVFNVAGEYVVRLTVAGPGGSDSTTQTVIVHAPPIAPIASFSAEPSSGRAPLTVIFINNSLDASEGFEWDFDTDGTVDSRDTNPSWIYASPGSYVAQLRALGGSAASVATVDILVEPPIEAPVALFATSTVSGDAPLQVVFTNQSTGDIENYQWDFQSDGVTDSFEAAPSFIFEDVGAYVVTLNASGPGGSSQATAEIIVTEAIAPPVAGFTTSINDLTVSFESTASGDNLIYNWDFGDGNQSTAEHPVHTYSAGGNYTVLQQASNPAGNDTFIVEVPVVAMPTPEPPAAGKIAFVSDRDGNNEIYVMNSDGSGAVNLTNNPSNDRHPSWSPDGQRLVFASRRSEDSFDIYLVDIESRAVTQLTHAGSDNRPAWSPVGGRIAFVSQRSGNKDIMIMNEDGSTQVQLTSSDANEDQPTWSPDGAHIAYVSDADGSRQLAVVSVADGAAINTIRSDSGENFLASWLNDPTRSLLLFTSTRFGDEDIFAVNPLNSEGLQQISSDATIERQPSWSRNGDLILFVSDRAGEDTRDIYTISSDGASLNRLTPDGSRDREPKWH